MLDYNNNIWSKALCKPTSEFSGNAKVELKVPARSRVLKQITRVINRKIKKISFLKFKKTESQDFIYQCLIFTHYFIRLKEIIENHITKMC